MRMARGREGGREGGRAGGREGGREGGRVRRRVFWGRYSKERHGSRVAQHSSVWHYKFWHQLCARHWSGLRIGPLNLFLATR